jgi:hypothetical protein
LKDGQGLAGKRGFLPGLRVREGSFVGEKAVQGLPAQRLLPEASCKGIDGGGREDGRRSGIGDDRLKTVTGPIPPGWVSGDGHHAGIETAEKGGDVVEARRVEEQGALPRQSTRLEHDSDGTGLAIQFAVSKSGFYGVGIRQEDQRRSARVLGSPPAENLN